MPFENHGPIPHGLLFADTCSLRQACFSLKRRLPASIQLQTVATPYIPTSPFLRVLLLLQLRPSLSVLTHHRFLIRFHSLWVFRGVLHWPRKLLFRSFIVIGRYYVDGGNPRDTGARSRALCRWWISPLLCFLSPQLTLTHSPALHTRPPGPVRTAAALTMCCVFVCVPAFACVCVCSVCSCDAFVLLLFPQPL